ncbi:HNH endonuclease [Nocardia gipuzkoensis]
MHRQKTARVTDSQPIRVDYPHKEILTRLLADTCELCGTVGHVEVHHIRKLANLGIPGPLQHQWVTAMADRRRKDPRGLRRLPRPHPHRAL